MENIGSVSVQVVADYSKLSQGFQAAQGEAAKAGSSIANSFQQAASDTSSLETTISAVVLSINRLTASLAQEAKAQEGAAVATRSHTTALHGQVSAVQATSAAIRTLEGSGGLRAVENFLAKTLGLGPALQAIFPIVGAIAFGEILVRLLGHVIEFFNALKQAPERAEGLFRQLNDSIQTTIDELQLSNDKLDQQIAKLSGHPQNGLKILLDEAIVAADKLAAALEKDISALAALLKQEHVGVLTGLITGVAPSDNFEKQLAGETGLGGKLADISRIRADGNAKIAAAGTLEQANAARTETRIALEKILNGIYDDRVKRLDQLKGITADTTPKTGPVALGGALPTGTGGPIDVRAETEKAAHAAQLAKQELARVGLEFANVTKTQTVTGLQAAKAASDAAKQAAQEQYREWEDELANRKAHDAVTLSDEQEFWRAKLAVASAGGAAYISVVRSLDTKLGNLNQQAIRRSIAEGNKSEAETYKEIEQSIKEAQEAAAEAGGHPAAIKLKILTELAGDNAPDTGLSADNQKKLAAQISDAQKAANHENTADLKQMLAEQDQAWQESGIRTAAEVKARAELTRSQLEDLRPFFTGIDALIDGETAKIIAAKHRIEAEKLRVADLVARNQEAGGETEIQSRKIALESAYGMQAAHTYQQEISYQEQLSALEAESLKLKLDRADAEYAAAAASRDEVRIQEALNAQAAAGAAIDLQAQKAAADLAKLKQSTSFGGQVAAGLTQDAQSAVTRLSSGIATLATQTKGWGQEFKNILKDIEKSIIQTFAKAALKQGLDALMNLGKQHQQTGGGGVLGTAVGAATGAAAKIGIGAATGGAQAAAQAANTAAMTAETAALVANTAAVGLGAAAETALTGLMTAQAIDLAANTVALAALTTAVVALTAVDAVAAILPFAAGGDPPVGVPSLVGEKGPELFIPRGAGTIIPADKTRSMLKQMQQSLSGFQIDPRMLAAPNAPASAFLSGSQAGNISSSTASSVTNQNTGRVGDSHYNIYGMNNPREVMRQIADFEKRQTGKYSPMNK